MRELKLLFFLYLIALPLYNCFSQNNQPSQLIKDKILQNLEIANNYIDKENDSALIYIKEAKIISNKNNYLLGKVKVMEAEGYYQLYIKNDYEKSQSIFLNCLKICNQNNLKYKGNIQYDLGRVFHLSDNYFKAKEYYSNSYKNGLIEKDTALIVNGLSGLATIAYREKNYAEAESYFEKSLRFPSINKTKSIIYSNYSNMKIRQEKYKDAIKYAVKAIQLNPIKGGDAIDYSRLLDAKNGANDYSGMDTILPYAIHLFEKTTSLRDKTIVLASISITHYNLKEYKKAADDKDLYIDLFYDLKAQERDKVVYEMETKYQTEKKEEQLKEQQKEKEKLRLFFILALITIALLSYLVYLNFNQKKRLAKQKKLLETAVDEKNILLKETHHRVKNSFQIVSSLLYLQSENMKDKDAALAVKEAQNRVKSMVLIHQKLYSKDQLIGIETKEYIEDLVNDIIENQTDTIPNLSTSVFVESSVFSIDSITPLGLIINELITNCIKHAFNPSIANPKIELEFKKQNDYYILKVIDNGIGFKNEISENSFGIKLITALAKKLKGEISFENKTGTHFMMKIHKFEEMN